MAEDIAVLLLACSGLDFYDMNQDDQITVITDLSLDSIIIEWAEKLDVRPLELADEMKKIIHRHLFIQTQW